MRYRAADESIGSRPPFTLVAVAAGGASKLIRAFAASVCCEPATMPAKKTVTFRRSDEPAVPENQIDKF